MHYIQSEAGVRMFEIPFPDDYHFVGDDHDFTVKVNEAIPLFADRIDRDGIQIPGGEISVISYVRKEKAYQQDPDGTGVWTFDRIREIPADHPVVQNFKQSIKDGSCEAMANVRQWFVIGRFQATPSERPPVFPFLYGFCGFRKEDQTMGGVFALTRYAEILFQLDGAPPERVKEVTYALNYECCETLRQVAAIVCLDEKTGG
jgi:hypothetical protein